jgi:hypothetical protein
VLVGGGEPVGVLRSLIGRNRLAVLDILAQRAKTLDGAQQVMTEFG